MTTAVSHGHSCSAGGCRARIMARRTGPRGVRPEPAHEEPESRSWRVAMPHPICVTCGTQFEESDRPPDRCPICDEERQYVNARGPDVDDDGRAAPGSPQRADRGRAAADRHPDGAGLRDRTARPARADAGRQRAVGLREPDRRGDRARGARARRHRGDRDLASPLLLVDGRVEPGVWRGPRVRARRGQGVGDALQPLDRAVGRGDAPAAGRRDADPVRRALSPGPRRCIGRTARRAGARS